MNAIIVNNDLLMLGYADDLVILSDFELSKADITALEEYCQ